MRRHRTILSALAIALAACGGDVGGAGPITLPPVPGPSTATTSPTEPPTTADPGATTSTTQPLRFVEVYFVQDGAHITAVTRTVPGTPDVAANALRELIAGPTAAEEAAGLSSAVPPETLLLGVDIDQGLATVDLSKEFEMGGGSFNMLSRLAQVVYTLTQFPTVDGVSFRLDGQPVTVFSVEGIVLDGPVDRADYAGLLPVGPAPDRWSQDDLPPVNGVPGRELGRVVLVAADDVLNVRLAAGVDHEIIGMLEPGVVVRRTGDETPVGASTWAEIAIPGGTGWVNARFLGAVVDDQTFQRESARILDLLEELATRMTERADLSPVASGRGLYVSHHAAPILFDPDELAAVMTDPTAIRWPSNALDPGSPEIQPRTFAEAVGDRFVDAFVDDDRLLGFDRPQMGGNGRPPELALPFELAGFHFVSVFDPGDDPQYEGLDWTTWHVSIDFEDDEPVVVGLTLDEWAP